MRGLGSKVFQCTGAALHSCTVAGDGGKGDGVGCGIEERGIVVLDTNGACRCVVYA